MGVVLFLNGFNVLSLHVCVKFHLNVCVVSIGILKLARRILRRFLFCHFVDATVGQPLGNVVFLDIFANVFVISVVFTQTAIDGRIINHVRYCSVSTFGTETGLCRFSVGVQRQPTDFLWIIS